MTMTIRKIVLCICSLAAAGMVSAQSPDTAKWTLRQCIDYAIENNIEIKQQALEVENTEIDLNTAKNSRLPSLSASASQSFNFGRSQSMETGIYEDNQTASTSLGLSSSTTLFSGNRINHQVKYNELNLMAAMENLNKAKENLGLQVASYYLDVLFKKELLNVALKQAELTEKQVSQTQALVESGKVAQSQLYDIRAQLAQNQLTITNAQNELALSQLNLSQLLNLPGTGGFDVVEPDADELISNNQATLLLPDDIYQIAIGIKPHVREAEYRLESSEQNVKIAQSSRYPSLSLGLSYNTGYSHIFKHDSDIDPFFDQLKNNRRQSIGLSLSIPIFNRLQTRNTIRSAKLTQENRMLELDYVKQSLYKEIQQAYQSATAAEAKYASTGVAYSAAEIAYEYAEELYRVGRSTVLEFSEAQNKLVTSQSEQIQAKYDYVFRAKILDFYRGEPIDLNY